MNQQFRIKPTISFIDTCEAFVQEFNIGPKDLILTNPSYYDHYFVHLITGAHVIYVRDYGKGEPTDETVHRIYADIRNKEFDRIIAIGGGSIIDIAKILALKNVDPIVNLYDGKTEIKREKKLLIVPTTCGTGSEVTSVAVLNVLEKGSKMGLQSDEEFADFAVLIPELLKGLPFRFFATSSIDALVHASESFLSPKATPISEIFSEKAIQIILNGYKEIAKGGKSALGPHLSDFLLASTYAGIAFANAGCAAVHAMSMPFSGMHHVAHGEANYAIFTQVFRTYERLSPDGKIKRYDQIVANVLNCSRKNLYDELEQLLNIILQKEPLSAYGVTKEEIPVLVDIVNTKQKRLTVNNYVPLSSKNLTAIYTDLL